MSKVVAHEQCPRCASQGLDTSKDNLAVYDDGHRWCFSCNYFKQASLEYRIRHQMSVNEDPKNLNFPDDYMRYIPRCASHWLNKYRIRSDEIAKHKFGWSEIRELLVMPVYSGDNELIFWQGRNFKLYNTFREHEASRYTGGGNKKDLMHIIYDPDKEAPKDGDNIVIIVEDLLSAIKVGRMYQSLCLFGSHVPLETLRRLHNRFKAVGVWLDPDKTTEAVRTVIRGSQYGDTFVVATSQDPKTYDINYIGEFVEMARRRIYSEEDMP